MSAVQRWPIKCFQEALLRLGQLQFSWLQYLRHRPSLTTYTRNLQMKVHSTHWIQCSTLNQTETLLHGLADWYIYGICVCVCVRPSPVNQSDFIFSSRPLRHWLFGAPSFFHLFCRFMMKLDVQPSCWSLHVYYSSTTRSSTYCKMASVCCCVILSTHLFDDYSFVENEVIQHIYL